MIYAGFKTTKGATTGHDHPPALSLAKATMTNPEIDKPPMYAEAAPSS